jgi:predicted transposase/invertase (TIGR01784 family)
VHDIEFNFIELPKFNKTLKETQNLIEKWVYFIKNAENLDVIPDDIEDEGLKTAYQEANKHVWTAEELEAYDYASMREEDERARLDGAEKKGKIEGKVEGKIEGKIEIAKKMLKLGTSVEMIAEITELSIEQIKALGAGE